MNGISNSQVWSFGRLLKSGFSSEYWAVFIALFAFTNFNMSYAGYPDNDSDEEGEIVSLGESQSWERVPSRTTSSSPFDTVSVSSVTSSQFMDYKRQLKVNLGSRGYGEDSILGSSVERETVLSDFDADDDIETIDSITRTLSAPILEDDSFTGKGTELLLEKPSEVNDRSEQKLVEMIAAEGLIQSWEIWIKSGSGFDFDFPNESELMLLCDDRYVALLEAHPKFGELCLTAEVTELSASSKARIERSIMLGLD